LQTPGILAGIPRIALVLAVPVIAFAVTVGISLGTGGSEKKQDPAVSVAVTNRQPLATSVPAAAPAAPVAPTATVLADRSDCGTIRGTDYRSNSERDWFQKNCTGSTASASISGGASGSSGGGSATSGSTSAGAAGGSSGQPSARAAATGSSAVPGVETPSGQRLVIPKASINADINVIKMTGYDMPDPKGYFNLLTYDMSALSGLGSNGVAGNGNLVLSGHVDCARCHNGGSGTAVLWHVRDLKAGDSAQVYTADGKVVNYVVSSSRVLSGERSGDWNSLLASGAADMTIITCTGTFSGGEYDKRHVVQFKKV
jgi:sortase (surface protein transpeptidase)